MECSVDELSSDTRRVLRAHLRAVAAAEPLQRQLARTYDLALGDFHALRLLHDLGPMPIGRLGAALQLATLLERLLQLGSTNDAPVERSSPAGLAAQDEPATQPIGAAPAAADRGAGPNPMQPEQSETCR
jgi:hypothetical protein